MKQGALFSSHNWRQFLGRRSSSPNCWTCSDVYGWGFGGRCADASRDINIKSVKKVRRERIKLRKYITPFVAALLVMGSESVASPDAGSVVKRVDAGHSDPSEARAPRPFKWEVPNVVSEVEMPGITWSMGVPVKMKAVTVKGDMHETMLYMFDSFTRQRLFVDHKTLDSPMLTGVHPDTFITYSALFQQNAPGYITVVLAEANLPKAKPPQGDTFVPLFTRHIRERRASYEAA